MCRRYSFFSSPETAGEQLKARPANFFNWQPHYNAVPGNWMPVVTNEFHDVIQFFRWGLTPQWAKDDKMGLGMYNTFSDKIKERPAYENIFKYKRCIVLADGWFFIPPAKKTKTDTGTPPALRIFLPGNQLLLFAGLWDVWGDGLNSFSIVTRTAPEPWAALFPEMPLLLNPEQAKDWLFKPPAGKKQLALLDADAGLPLEYYPVQRQPLVDGLNEEDVILNVD